MREDVLGLGAPLQTYVGVEGPSAQLPDAMQLAELGRRMRALRRGAPDCLVMTREAWGRLPLAAADVFDCKPPGREEPGPDPFGEFTTFGRLEGLEVFLADTPAACRLLADGLTAAGRKVLLVDPQ